MYASAPAGRKRPFGGLRRASDRVHGFTVAGANPARIEVEKDPHPCIPLLFLTIFLSTIIRR
jgi:hypothetical protein